jgi:hypothetical protein
LNTNFSSGLFNGYVAIPTITGALPVEQAQEQSIPKPPELLSLHMINFTDQVCPHSNEDLNPFITAITALRNNLNIWNELLSVEDRMILARKDPSTLQYLGSLEIEHENLVELSCLFINEMEGFETLFDFLPKVNSIDCETWMVNTHGEKVNVLAPSLTTIIAEKMLLMMYNIPAKYISKGNTVLEVAVGNIQCEIDFNFVPKDEWSRVIVIVLPQIASNNEQTQINGVKVMFFHESYI